MLNNPSSSEYIASVRSSIRSINEIGSAQFNPHPRLIGKGRESVPSTVLTSASPYPWIPNAAKSSQSSDDSETKNKSVIFSSNFNCGFVNKSFLGFCATVWTVLVLGVAAAGLLYFTGKSITWKFFYVNLIRFYQPKEVLSFLGYKFLQVMSFKCTNLSALPKLLKKSIQLFVSSQCCIRRISCY